MPSPVTESLWGAYDLMYSGHTSTLFSLASDPFGYILAFFGAFVVIGTRTHYTIDVAIAIVVTELLKNYIWSKKDCADGWCLKNICYNPLEYLVNMNIKI